MLVENADDGKKDCRQNTIFLEHLGNRLTWQHRQNVDEQQNR